MIFSYGKISHENRVMQYISMRTTVHVVFLLKPNRQNHLSLQPT